MVKLSVIIPVYRAQQTLRRATDSLPPTDGVELVLCIDDGEAYSLDRPDCTWLRSPTPRSGAGPVRNRCLAAARGDYAMFLDADDRYTPGSLAAVLRALDAGPDLLFPHMSVQTDGGARFDFTEGLRALTLQTLADRPFTYHPILRRDWAGPFSDLVAQDVDHAARALSRAGGTAALVDGARYVIHRQPSEGSVSRAADYAAKIDRAYRRYADASDDPAVTALFERRIAFNQRYVNAGDGQDFYDFWRATKADG